MSENGDDQQLDEAVKALPIEERVPVIVLKKLLEERRALDRQREEEVDKVQAKYRELVKPNILRASEIIKGGAIKDEELSGKDKYLNAAEANHFSQYTKGSKIKHYWAAVFETSKLEELITDDDRNCLNALEDLKATASPTAMTVTFEFSENPYFAAGTFTREMVLSNGIPVECKGDLLKWKAGKSLVEPKKKGKNTEQPESFFKFFTNTKAEDELDVDLIQQQGMIFSEIVNDLVPWSLEYYLGLVDNEDDEDMDDEEDDEAEDDEEEDRPRKQQHKS